MKKEKNLFITFEGIDGSGKNTQLTRLVDAISDHNNGFPGDKYSTFWLSREPTKITRHGIDISNGITTEKGVSGDEAYPKFVKDRIYHTHNYILPRLAEGNFVLVNRYDISTLMYQYTQGVDFDKLYNAHNYDS